MKLVLKLSILLSGLVSAAALTGFLYLLPGYAIGGPFMQILNRREYRELSYLVHVWFICSVTGVGVTIWLWRTYRRQYGKRDSHGILKQH